MIFSREDIAFQIANLINSQNRLERRYTADMVLEKFDNYIYDTLPDYGVIGCVCARRVQWYQAEIRHLSVHPYMQRMGVGLRMLKAAEKKCRNLDVRIAQSTVKTCNMACRSLMKRRKFSEINQFNDIIIYQKVFI